MSRAISDARAGPPGTLTVQNSEICFLLVSTHAISLQHALLPICLQ